jgi:hemolysin activation/secretion protein
MVWRGQVKTMASLQFKNFSSLALSAVILLVPKVATALTLQSDSSALFPVSSSDQFWESFDLSTNSSDPGLTNPDLTSPNLTGLDLASLDSTDSVSSLATRSTDPITGNNTSIPLSGVESFAPTLAQVTAPAPSLEVPLPTIPQADPNRDRIPQPIQPDREPDNDNPILEAPPAPTQTLPPAGSGATVFIKTIEVGGSTVYSPEQLQAAIGSYEGRDLTLEDLQQAADAITQLYLNDGYITSRAVLVDQAIENGVVRVQVIEGSLAKIDIEGTSRLSQKYIRSRIELGAGTPLRTDRLEDQLRLLRVDPNISNIEASLRAGEKLGESNLLVRVTEANNVGGFLGTDNYSPESVGGQRTRAEIYYRNLFGNGETLTGSWDRTYIGGSDVYRLTYRQPVNARNGTVQAQVTIDRNEIIQSPFDRFDISGETERYDLSFRQPVIRNPRQELGLSISLTHQRGRTFVGNVATQLGTTTGADENGNTILTVIKLGQDYVRRDPQGAWAAQSQFSIGTNWLGATENSGDIPDSQFLSWLGQAQRVQRINDRNLLILQTDLQFTPGPLLSSQQFVMGGGQSIRGYRQNIRAGDNGFRFSGENRITVRRDQAGRSVLQVAPFFDAGIVWNNGDNPNPIKGKKFLAGIGFGVLWQPMPQMDMRVDFGLPLVEVSDEGKDPLQSRGLYFSLNYRYPR